MTQLVYTISSTNSHVVTNNNSLHLWGKKHLVNCQNISKYYDHDGLQNFLLLFMSVSTGQVVINSHILTWISFVILKKHILDKTWNLFNTNVGPKWNDWKSSYQARQFFSLFFSLFPLILSWNCVKYLRVTKIVKKSGFKEPGAS